MPDLEEDDLYAVRAALFRGEIVGLPTDTVYGLGVRAEDPAALSRLFLMKERPTTVALPVVVADIGAARALTVNLGAVFEALAARYWPGALTIVCERRPGLQMRIGGDDATIGLRVPDEEAISELSRATGPIALTSANRHGDLPCTSAEMIRLSFPGEGLTVLDRGERSVRPSTVVSVVGDTLRVLREGTITLRELEEVARSGSLRGDAAPT